MHLVYSRDGKLVASSGARDVALIDVTTGEVRHRIAIADPQSLAATGDQLWIATKDGELVRCALDGRILGTHALAWDPSARLIGAPVGPAAALWTGKPAAL